MRTIIAGGRDIGYSKDINKMIREIFAIFEFINECPWRSEITHILSGKCKKGVDVVGELWATANGIPILPFEANWPLFGLSAGPIRNEEMAKVADGLILYWNGKSKGSRSMLELAEQYNLELHVKEI